MKTPEEIMSPREIAERILIETANVSENGKPYVAEVSIAESYILKALKIKEDQHNKELEEIREELENTKTELAAYKLLRSVYHDKFVKILEVIHNQVSVEHAELLDKHIK